MSDKKEKSSLLNTFVDKIFIINLKERKDKYEKITKQLKELNITNYERFEAIKPTQWQILHNPYLQALYKNNCFGIGVIGCKLSHAKAIELAKERKYKSILILEDDARFLKDFEENLKSAIGQLELIKEWDMLYLGANHKKKGIVQTKNLKRVFNAYTTSSYIIKDTLYDEVLNNAIKEQCEIDTFYVNFIQKKYKVLGVHPNFIDQYPSKSDISGNMTDYEFGEC